MSILEEVAVRNLITEAAIFIDLYRTNETIGLRYWDLTKDKGTHAAEDCCIGANAECECHNCDKRNRGSFCQHANGVTEIFQHSGPLSGWSLVFVLSSLYFALGRIKSLANRRLKT